MLPLRLAPYTFHHRPTDSPLALHQAGRQALLRADQARTRLVDARPRREQRGVCAPAWPIICIIIRIVGSRRRGGVHPRVAPGRGDDASGESACRAGGAAVYGAFGANGSVGPASINQSFTANALASPSHHHRHATTTMATKSRSRPSRPSPPRPAPKQLPPQQQRRPLRRLRGMKEEGAALRGGWTSRWWRATSEVRVFFVLSSTTTPTSQIKSITTQAAAPTTS